MPHTLWTACLLIALAGMVAACASHTPRDSHAALRYEADDACLVRELGALTWRAADAVAVVEYPFVFERTAAAP